MKSFIFWISGTIAGALIGYGIAMIFDFNLFISVGCGLIFGSTTAITLNILRDKEVDYGEKEPPKSTTDPVLNELHNG